MAGGQCHQEHPEHFHALIVWLVRKFRELLPVMIPSGSLVTEHRLIRPHLPLLMHQKLLWFIGSEFFCLSWKHCVSGWSLTAKQRFFIVKPTMHHENELFSAVLCDLNTSIQIPWSSLRVSRLHLSITCSLFQPNRRRLVDLSAPLLRHAGLGSLRQLCQPQPWQLVCPGKDRGWH